MALPGNHGISKRKKAAILPIMELTNEGDGAAKRGKKENGCAGGKKRALQQHCEGVEY